MLAANGSDRVFRGTRWWRTRRLSQAVSIAVVVLVPVLAFRQQLLGNRTLYFGDTAEYFVPMYRLVADTWLRGELPSWNRYAFSGYPLIGSSQGGVFYFPHVLYGVFNPVRVHTFMAVGHLVLGALGARAFARRLWRSDVAATASGVAYAFNAFAIAHLTHPVLAPASAWTPWALLGMEHLMARIDRGAAWAGRLGSRTWWRSGVRESVGLLAWCAAVAAPLMMIAFAGHPQGYWIAATATALFGVLRALSSHTTAATFVGSMRRRAVAAAWALGAVALSGALAAVQLITTAAYAQGSGRPSLTLGQAMTYSYRRSHLPLLLYPYLFGATGGAAPYGEPYRGFELQREIMGYVGLAALVLAIAGLPLVWRRPGGRALAAMVPLQIALVLGRSTPIGPWVFETVPFFDRFRAWGRHVLVIDLAIAVLAGAGVMLMVRGTSSMRRAALRRALIAVLALGAIGWWSLHASASRFLAAPPARALAVVLPMAAALAALAACGLALAHRRVAGALAVAILLGDGWGFAASSEWSVFAVSPDLGQVYLGPEQALPGEVSDEPGGIDRFVISVPLLQMTWVGKGVLSINGYDPLFPQQYATAVSDMSEYGGLGRSDVWGTSAVADLLRVTTLLLQPDPNRPTPDPDAGWNDLGPVPNTPVFRYQRTPLLAEAFVVGAARAGTFSDAVAALRAAPGAGPPLDPASLVLYDQPCAICPGAADPGSGGRAGAVLWGESSARVRVDATRPSIVVLSQAWAKGWRAEVDGDEVPVVRVYGLVMGAPVPTGEHVVRFFYDPPGLRRGLLISALSSLVLIAAVVGWARRRSATASGAVAFAERVGRLGDGGEAAKRPDGSEESCAPEDNQHSVVGSGHADE